MPAPERRFRASYDHESPVEISPRQTHGCRYSWRRPPFRIGGACTGRNLNGTFMIIRRAKRRSRCRHGFLWTRRARLRLGGLETSFTNRTLPGQVFFHLSKTVRWDKFAINFSIKREKTLGDMDPVFGPVVMCPPVTPSAGSLPNDAPVMDCRASK